MKQLKHIFLLLVLAGVSGGVMAENGHAYNGSYCDAYGAPSSDIRKYTTGAYNAATSGRGIICPVIVDEINTTAGTTRVWVHYTGSGRVSCTLYSKHGNGTNVQANNGFRDNTGWFNISNITTDDYWGNYNMYCYLPSGGTLNTIWLGEQ